ncbi:uncharacterized protein LOC143033186 [Oratosquilla oratoria]|uniref:uncharacterized protein LOC143033186 n=1 Tax=Oratosquilla oratoria TaxID=337810 RepID=UPI003F757667
MEAGGEFDPQSLDSLWYVNPEGLNLEEKERFYEELQDTIDRMPNRDISLIIGDLNGHVGLRSKGIGEVGGEFSIGDINENGNRIMDSVRKSQTHSVKAIPSLSLDSDHRAVVPKVNITIPHKCRRLKRKRIEIKNLKDQRVREELEDKLVEITITGETIEQQWKIAQSQINNIAEEVVGVKWTGGCKKKRTAYWNEEKWQRGVQLLNKGNLLTEPEEIDKRWKEYFSSLLNIEEDGERTDEEQSNGDWVDEEEGINESEALAEIKNNKACGKIYERVLEARLRDRLEHILAEAQHGFGSNRGTSDLIFALKMILKKPWEFDKDKYVKFLDLEKAFDRVPRDKLWSVLQSAEYQIPPKLRRAIKSLYTSNNTAVKPISETIQWFDISSEVRHCSVLSQMIFIILKDEMIK